MSKVIESNVKGLSSLRRRIVVGWALPVIIAAGAACIAAAAAYCAACALSVDCPEGQHVVGYDCDTGICGALFASCEWGCAPDTPPRSEEEPIGQ